MSFYDLFFWSWTATYANVGNHLSTIHWLKIDKNVNEQLYSDFLKFNN